VGHAGPDGGYHVRISPQSGRLCPGNQPGTVGAKYFLQAKSQIGPGKLTGGQFVFNSIQEIHGGLDDVLWTVELE